MVCFYKFMNIAKVSGFWVASGCPLPIAFKVLLSLSLCLNLLRHSKIHVQDGANFEFQDFIHSSGHFPDYEIKYTYCLLALHGQGKQCTPGAATCELTRTFSLIPGNCNLNWQKQATFGLCSKPYFHDSINPGMLFVKQATEMLWLIVVILSFGRMG
jgi:hypothetical protein